MFIWEEKMTSNNLKYPLLLEEVKSGMSINLTAIKSKELIKELQLLLNDKGFKAGKVDGIVGQQTMRAFEKAKDFLNLQYPQILGPFTIQKLLEIDPINTFFLPTNGIGRISSDFGYRIHPIAGTKRLHRGVDIAASIGTVIYAVADGIVNQSVSGCTEGNRSCGGGFGNFIRINHVNIPEFTQSVYAHLQKVFVKQNESVTKGQKIGTLGNTGSSTGAHLHFELWKNSTAFNPLDVMEIL